MSELPDAPEPKVDADPDASPGGPADRIDRDADDFPVTTPDAPRSAQVDDEVVPDELDQPDESGGEEEDVDPAEDEPV